MIMLAKGLRRIAGIVALCVAVGAVVAGTASAANVNDPAVVAAAKSTAKHTAPGLTVSFQYGLYDAANGDVYVDGNPDAVWRIQGHLLVPHRKAHKDSDRYGFYRAPCTSNGF
jgi:nitrous oxide reductase